MSDEAPTRLLQAGRRCRVRLWRRATGQVETVHESSTRLYEAPNWTADGRLVITVTDCSGPCPSRQPSVTRQVTGRERIQ
jgi:hypothetical protein